ncbi:type IV secretory system conjugative DNA transfer family protein [Roseomonas mucosa]|uniref:type IV secretory system conjugative DNA transfer family protein n=3 Tax=Roseomonas mucosa TaxID=207340 RepID=UPI0028CD7F99|nr:type IV secretory system conjugative DNA transfer family protein [Roseomonas mucosa]MDT8292065.1 type IV secretory system conjugative DNA transfer family protein [Roseomonas mucosa]
MAGLPGVLVGMWAAWTFGSALSWDYGLPWWLGFLIPFVLGFLPVSIALSMLKVGLSGGGLWTSPVVRRVVGMVANGLLFGVLVLLWFACLRVLRQFPRQAPDTSPGLQWLLAVPTLAVALWLAWLVVIRLPPRLKVWIGRATAPIRALLRFRHVGVGGSSRFRGLFDDWAHQWRPGQVLLGASLYDPDWKVGRSDDRHFITIATSRSGKGRAGIIPNLLTWPGSALVIDPKGQNAAITAAARGQGGGRVKRALGQQVRIVDPFRELEGAGVTLPVQCFNPLADIDPAALDVAEQVGSIADALVVPDSRGPNFWDSSAKALLTGLIAYVVSSPAVLPDNRNLVTVRRLLTDPDGPPVEALAQLAGPLGDLATSTAAKLRQAGPNSRGDILATALTHTEWLDSPAMQATMARSDFSLRDLKATPTTVYLVLPPQYLEEHRRFLRLFVNVALHAASHGAKPRHPVLFLLDEFYALGRIDLLSKAAGLLAGYGVKLWPIVQNLSQLQELLPYNWETFLGNAGMWQVFAVNDQTTARYLSERLGHHIAWRKMGTGAAAEWVPQGASFLRTAVELARETSRDSGNMVVFVEGGDSFLLRRLPYDQAFTTADYAPDPFEPAAQEKRPDWAQRGDEWVERKSKDWEDRWNAKLDAWEAAREAKRKAKEGGPAT